MPIVPAPQYSPRAHMVKLTENRDGAALPVNNLVMIMRRVRQDRKYETSPCESMGRPSSLCAPNCPFRTLET
jgi:hypothetical protein